MEYTLERNKLKKYYTALGIVEVLGLISIMGSLGLGHLMNVNTVSYDAMNFVNFGITLLISLGYAVSYFRKNAKMCGVFFSVSAARTVYTIITYIVEGTLSVGTVTSILVLICNIVFAYGFLNSGKLNVKLFSRIAVALSIAQVAVAFAFNVFEQLSDSSAWIFTVIFILASELLGYILTVIFKIITVKVICIENELNLKDEKVKADIHTDIID